MKSLIERVEAAEGAIERKARAGGGLGYVEVGPGEPRDERNPRIAAMAARCRQNGGGFIILPVKGSRHG